MTVAIARRAIPPPTDPANRASIEALRTAVNELSGTVGDFLQRAVRTCELIDAGLMKLDVTGALIMGDGLAGGSSTSGGPYLDLSTAQTAAGAKTWSGLATFNGGVTVASNLTIGGSGRTTNTGIELGATGGVATTSYLDFHSGATAVDYDARISTSGGDGTVGNGTLSLSAGTISLLPGAAVTIGSQSGGGVGQLRIEDATDARLGLTKTGSRRWTIGTLGTDFTVRDESGVVTRIVVTSAGYTLIGSTGAAALSNSFHTLIVGDRAAGDGIASLLLNPSATGGGMGFVYNPTTNLLTINDWGTAGAPARLGLTRDGRLYGTALHNNANAVTGTTNQYIASGTYTPTATLGTNAAGCSVSAAQWMRVGNVVTVSGRIDVSCTTASNTSTAVDLSLPIASALSNSTQCCGGGGISYLPRGAVQVSANTTAKTATVSFNCAATAATALVYCFTYLIL